MLLQGMTKKLTLVVVMEADVGFTPSISVGQKVGATNFQVSGRSGPTTTKAKSFQTYDANNPILLSLIRNGYKSFAENELQIRENDFHLLDRW